MSLEKTARSIVFERYLKEVKAIVSLLEEISEHNDKIWSVKDVGWFSDLDEILEGDLFNEEEVEKKKTSVKKESDKDRDSLISTLHKAVEHLEEYRKFNFNMERLIDTYNLGFTERLVLYTVVIYSLFSKNPHSPISVKRILNMISVNGEIYLTHYPLVAPSSRLSEYGIIKISKDSFFKDSSNYLSASVSISNNTVMLALTEQAPWRVIQNTKDTASPAKKDSERPKDTYLSVLENISPKDIVKELDKYVIGQRRAKKVLAVQSYLHYMRVRNEATVPMRSNIMMIGHTGVGKTYLASKLAEILSLPFVRSDVTTLTETGYVGDDVEVVLYELIRKAGGDLSLAERGIVFLDEIDKIARAQAHQSTTGNPSDKAVQEALLSMLNGEDVRVPESGDRRMLHSSESLTINTGNILFILGGAFVGLEEVIASRLKGEGTIGFNRPLANDKDERETILKQVDVKDLEKYGMIPEFLGRVPVTVTLDSLSASDLKTILTSSADSPLKKYSEFFKAMGKRLSVNDDALSIVAERALEMNMGARALKSVVESLMLNIIYNMDNISGGSVRITAKQVASLLDEDESDIFDDENTTRQSNFMA